MSEGMRPAISFRPDEFARAAFATAPDARFSFDRLRANAEWVPPFAAHVEAHASSLVRSAWGRATQFVDVDWGPQDVRLHLVCGSAWDAFVLRPGGVPEVYIDVGRFGAAPLDTALAAFRPVLEHELWHVAFDRHRALHWPKDDGPRSVAEEFFFVMLNEGVGHYYSLLPKLSGERDDPKLGARTEQVFVRLAQAFPRLVATTDPAEQARRLRSAHTGVPFWEKWGAVPGALVVHRLRVALGDAALKQLLQRGPYRWILRYDERSVNHRDWPKLPALLVARARTLDRMRSERLRVEAAEATAP